MLNLSFSTRCELSHALIVCGGATTSIFPQAEAWLLADGDRQKALEYVAARKNIAKYQSLMDFLFCEIFTEYRKPCFRYYLGGGPQLKEIITVEQLTIFGETLLLALVKAHSIWEEKRRLSWGMFRSEVLWAA